MSGRRTATVSRGMSCSIECDGIQNRRAVRGDNCPSVLEPLWFNTPAETLLSGPFRGPNVPPSRKLEFPILNDGARRSANRWIPRRRTVNPLSGSADVRLQPESDPKSAMIASAESSCL